MPARSKKQQRLMCAVAHNPKVAKKTNIPKSVGAEYCTKVVKKKKKKS